MSKFYARLIRINSADQRAHSLHQRQLHAAANMQHMHVIEVYAIRECSSRYPSRTPLEAGTNIPSPGPPVPRLQGARIAGPLETGPPSLTQQPIAPSLSLWASLPGFCLPLRLCLSVFSWLASRAVGVMRAEAGLCCCCLSFITCHSQSARVSHRQQ